MIHFLIFIPYGWVMGWIVYGAVWCTETGSEVQAFLIFLGAAVSALHSAVQAVLYGERN